MANEREDLFRRIEEYEASQGYRVAAEIRAERTSYDIFLGNYSELKVLLGGAKDPRVYRPLWDPGHRDRLMRFNREVARLLHNYVASVKSLVEHTRRIMNKKYAATEFRKEYQKQVDENFSNSPLAQFVEDLRNYMLHRSPLAASLIMSRGELHEEGSAAKSYMALNVVALREWDGWSLLGSEYLNKLGERPSLEEIMGAYKDRVVRFQTWYGPQLTDQHREEFIEMARLEDRIREIEPTWQTGYGDVNTLKPVRPRRSPARGKDEA